jgi:hypothetical protein
MPVGTTGSLANIQKGGENMEAVMTEKDLLIKLREAKFKKEFLESELKAATAEFDKQEAILVEMLTEKDAKTTAKYDGIGSVTLLAPLVRAQTNKEYEGELFEFVKTKGEEAIIKLAIHPQSLNGFVGRCLDRGDQLPEFLTYYLQPSIRCNFVK